jgi:hypothetical protein
MQCQSSCLLWLQVLRESIFACMRDLDKADRGKVGL